ncbi:MAG: hypothetical protein LBC02_01070 [Planctomycetaceae bacterium]|jgi:hypothetical protein|nr:hypothetical protein [Planctomycetaceae bacterium]
MIPDVNELDTPVIEEIVADLEGFEKVPESPNPKCSKWQWILDLIKISNRKGGEL